MKRLRKKAFIGNIVKSDLEFQDSGDIIECFITNQEKIINEVEYAGRIEYEIFEEEKEIFVKFVYVDSTYKDTKVAMYMLKHFEETKIEDYYNQYGKELVLSATYLNHDLAPMVERYCKKKGIQFKNLNHHPSKDLYNDEHLNYLNSLGIEAEKSRGTIIIRNAEFDTIVNAMSEINYKTNRNGLEALGVICDNGDIEYTVFKAVFPDNGLQFTWSQADYDFIDVHDDKETLINKINTMSTMVNFERIFYGKTFLTYDGRIKYEQLMQEVDR